VTERQKYDGDFHTTMRVMFECSVLKLGSHQASWYRILSSKTGEVT